MPSDCPTALETVSISVGGEELFRDISLYVRRSSLIVIGGSSSCGKSSLLRLFWGGLRPDSGAVLADQRDLTRASARRRAAWRRRIGIFCDDFPLLPGWTVFENTAVALNTMADLSKKNVTDRVGNQLRKWNLLTKRHLKAGALADGERTRLALARAFVRRPVAAFLDEPLAKLPPIQQKAARALLKQETLSGTAVVVATTDWENWADSADKIYLAAAGELHLYERTPTAETV